MASIASDPPDTDSPAAPKRVPRMTKIAYGVGDIGAAIFSQVTGFLLNPFLLDVARIRPDFVAIIMLIANLSDGLIDPLLGTMSDRTRTRWGRRRPWLLFGAVPFGLAFFLQWTVPPLNGVGLFIYFLLATIFLRITFSAVNVPYTAMTPEIAADYDERTSLTSYRFAFSIMGGVLSVLFYTYVAGMFDSPQRGSSVAAGILSVVIVVATLTAFFFTRERPIPETEDEHMGILEGLRVVFSNYPFVAVLGIFLISWLVVEFIQSNLLLYLRYWMGAEEHFTRLVLLIQVTSFSFLPVWSYVCGRFGKKTGFYIGLSVFIPLLGALYVLQPGQIIPLYIISFFAGMCVSMSLLIPWSMLPDVIDYEEAKTGHRRSGVYYGLFVFIQTLGVSLALAFSPFYLARAGYITPEVAGQFVAQPQAVLDALRLMVSLIPMGMLILCIPLAITYPITREKFVEIRAQLDANAAKIE